ncbi:hypothetical protein [uncultured Serinicoccus sp.]|uniref:hypothetical protein n=1 Tax=uncultured Serinicoccus sp. TaxID=735514 RepID=UPI00261806AF|nr:hypothetical protein [uncultured Serinicoccus sp.]
MQVRGWARAAALTVATLVMTSCASADGFADLEREAQSGDAPPVEADMPQDAGVLPDTSRLVGTHEGVDLGLARTSEDGVCLLMYPDEEDWVWGCTERTPLTVANGSRSFVVVRDGEEAPDGATQVSDNVYAH